MMFSGRTPHALLIEDDPLDAQIEQITLEQAGFVVVSARSLLEGETCAMQMLSLDAKAMPATLVLLDLMMPDPSHPDLEGAVLAGVLRRRMQTGMIRPAWLLALTNFLTVEREDEALFAGCHHVLAKPLTNQSAVWLRQHVEQPPVLSEGQPDIGRRLYQEKAEEILGIVRRGQPPRKWTAEDVHLVLSALTHYPEPQELNRARRAALLIALGGQEAAVAQLRRCATQLEPLNRTLLTLFLEGHHLDQVYQKREYDPQLMFDRSTIFRHIQKLPQSISPFLR